MDAIVSDWERRAAGGERPSGSELAQRLRKRLGPARLSASWGETERGTQ